MEYKLIKQSTDSNYLSISSKIDHLLVKLVKTYLDKSCILVTNFNVSTASLEKTGSVRFSIKMKLNISRTLFINSDL